ncbi:hypothetical protein LCGC14_1197760 [marine sediment metagenome]|uniref:Uncharacterized protein n=1 Tax=marine sediment metagenome TaxID=412755 RepID=A0A0F9LHT7_9ZZZZ
MAVIKKKAKAKRKHKRPHGTRSREKGNEGERDVANALKKEWPVLCEHARRGLQDRDGIEACDVEGVPGMWVESKKEVQNNVRKTLRQMAEKCQDGRIPFAVIKDDGKPPFVVMPFESLVRILNEASFAETQDAMIRLRPEPNNPGAESP